MSRPTPDDRSCPHPRCGASIRRDTYACSRHWFMLPRAVRNPILDAWRLYRGDPLAHAGVLLDAQSAAEDWWDSHV